MDMERHVFVLLHSQVVDPVASWNVREDKIVNLSIKHCRMVLHSQVVDPVASWNVQRLVLAREKRHMDAPVMLELYRWA